MLGSLANASVTPRLLRKPRLTTVPGAPVTFPSALSSEPTRRKALFVAVPMQFPSPASVPSRIDACFTGRATIKLRAQTPWWSAASHCPPQPFGLAWYQPSTLLSAATVLTRQSRPRKLSPGVYDCVHAASRQPSRNRLTCTRAFGCRCDTSYSRTTLSLVVWAVASGWDG